MVTRHWLSSLLLLIVLTVLLNGSRAFAETPARPFPQHETYAPNTILPNHRTQAQLDADVAAFYDYWKTSYVVQDGSTGAGNPLYRVRYAKNSARTVSEGQGYGMVIMPLMAGHDPDAQTIFDGLWEFSRAHPSSIDSRLMDWAVPDPNGNNSAFDGDADIAYGLLLADAQWGSLGRINYLAEAKTVIAGILESTIGPDSYLPMLGDWVNPNGSPHSQWTTRPSDFMISHFRAYRAATGDPVWDDVIAATQDVITKIQQNQAATTGLLPDFAILPAPDRIPQPAPAGFLEGPNDGYFYYNAGRTPWRIGLDGVLNNDAVSLAQASKIALWAKQVTNGNPQNIKAGYQLDGTPIGNYFTTFFVAPMGVAAMTDPSLQTWLNSIYDSVYNSREDYYEDSVNMMSLLVMSGNFWDYSADVVPTPTPTTASTTPLPTNTATVEPTATPTLSATTPTVMPTDTATPQPTATATVSAITPTVAPTSTPMLQATATMTPSADVVIVYDDLLQSGWSSDFSWGSNIDFAATSEVYRGTQAISVAFTEGWGALSLRFNTPIPTNSYGAIGFAVYGGTGGTKLNVHTQPTDSGVISTQSMFVAPAGVWTYYVVPLSDLGNPAQIARINIQSDSSNPQGMIYVDQIQLLLSSSPTAVGFKSAESLPFSFLLLLIPLALGLGGSILLKRK